MLLLISTVNSLLCGCSEGVFQFLWPLFTSAASVLYFLFLTFSFFFSVYSHPGCQSSSRPLVILREILWFTSILHSPQCLRLCVPLVISIQSPHSATYFTVSHIKTCTMALRGSFSGSVLLLPRYNFISWKLTHFVACLKKRGLGDYRLQSCCCWHRPVVT